MIVLYFHLDESAPVMRYWPAVPRIGETVSLPEFGGILNPLQVSNVVWEGFDDASVSVFLQPARVERPNGARVLNGEEIRT
jgi:hypothetical protein